MTIIKIFINRHILFNFIDMELLQSWRKGSAYFQSSALANSAITNLKNVNTSLPTLNKILPSLNYVWDTSGLITINKHTLAEVEPLLRAGQLKKFFAQVNPSVSVSTDMQHAFQQLIKNVPDVRLYDLDTEIIKYRKLFPELDVSGNTVESVQAKLSPAAKTRVDGALAKLKAYVAAGGKITLIIGGIVIAANIWQNLIDATNARIGCFLVYSVNNKTTSYKLMNRTCANSLEPPTEDTPPEYPALPFNTMVMLLYLLKTGGIDATDFTLATGLSINTDADLSAILTTTNFAKAVLYYNDNIDKFKTINVCEYISSVVESGIVPTCRCCTSSASEISTRFIDTSKLPDNISLHCVTQASILDTLVDAGISIGENILGAAGLSSASIGNLFSNPFVIGVIILIIVAFVIGLFVKLFGNQKNKNKYPGYTPLQQNSQYNPAQMS